MLTRNLLILLLLVTAGLSLSIASQAQEPETYLQWERMTERENGTPLPLEEIGGYDIHAYGSDGERTVIRVTDPEAIGIDLDGIQAERFEIAGYDTEGLYSEFIEITPVRSSRPKPPSDFRFYEEWPDPEDCTDCIILESSLILRPN